VVTYCGHTLWSHIVVTHCGHTLWSRIVVTRDQESCSYLKSLKEISWFWSYVWFISLKWIVETSVNRICRGILLSSVDVKQFHRSRSKSFKNKLDNMHLHFRYQIWFIMLKALFCSLFESFANTRERGKKLFQKLLSPFNFILQLYCPTVIITVSISFFLAFELCILSLNFLFSIVVGSRIGCAFLVCALHCICLLYLNLGDASMVWNKRVNYQRGV